MEIFIYISIFLLIVVILYEAYLIYKRNRSVLVKGKDDYFVLMALLLMTFLIFPFKQNELLADAVRNLLLIVAILTTFLIKRGINEQGVVKVFFTVPWKKITSVVVEENKSSSSNVIFHFYSNSDWISKWKLQFKLRHVETAMDICAKYVEEVKINPELVAKLQKYKNYFG